MMGKIHAEDDLSEIPLEEIKKEVEELEEVEIVPEETEVSEVREKEPGSLSIAGVLLGYIIEIGMIIGFTIIAGFTDTKSILQVLAVGNALSNAFSILISILHIPSQAPAITDYSSMITYWIVSLKSAEIFGSMGDVALIVISLLPFVLAGFIAGALCKNGVYGALAGLLIWLVGIIVSVVIALAMPSQLGVTLKLSEVIFEQLKTMWALIFLAVFGFLGGQSRAS